MGNQSVSRHVGDPVVANETVVAVMQPTVPSFIDVRSRGQLEAELAAVDDAVKQGEAEVRRLEAAVAFSRVELQRAEPLARTQNVSAQAVDKARFEVDTNEAALASAKAQVECGAAYAQASPPDYSTLQARPQRRIPPVASRSTRR
jgi:HlyD family secretion protein